MFPKKIHRFIFLIGTAGLVVGLPLSPFLLNCSQLLLSLNWLLELDYKEKLSTLFRKKSILILISIYLLHVIWLINTTDFSYASADLIIKLPLFALPIIYGTANQISGKEFKLFLLLFVTSVTISTLVSASVLLGLTNLDLVDSRNASLIISHIRFALLIVLSICILIYYSFLNNTKPKRKERLVYLGLIVWLIVFLVLLRSFTGIVILILLVPVINFWWSIRSKKRLQIKLSVIIMIFLIGGLAYYSIHSYNRFHKKHEVNLNELSLYTDNGNKYVHYKELKEYENGYLVGIYHCEKELRTEWDKISSYKYNSLDRKGQPIKTTLIRYLTSLGYKKDSVGISMLTPDDIEMIEKGYTNHLYKKEFSLYPRIYEILWEIERYKSSHDPSGRSVAQRIEYTKTAFRIIKRNFWFGAGTGDVAAQFELQYNIDNSMLKPQWRHRAHNQFITFLISFGIFGFIWWLVVVLYPPVLEKKYKHFLFLSFFLIAILSMLTEDTLETSAGVSFFAFFYSFFLYMDPSHEENKHDKSE